ncbi:hypothetical protein CBER1_08618 [Cercospora berteroae]|uniref:Uncharacterized protein n=1 Tax=Cercospora berteroae TaxID=357750 RepID=A0A2S6BV46_9PEZI|nr:hypothetical protein CBER1_08618 [Cercospora berteroae]
MSPWPLEKGNMLVDSDREAGLLTDGLDSYWRMDSYAGVADSVLAKQLRKAGYKISRSPRPTKEALVARYQRIDKGLLCYDTCSVEELRAFAEARGLQIDNSRRRKRTRLVETLEKVDSKRPFHRFMDLPAELRVSIYEFYISDFPALLHKPTQPPLARTSQLIRQELLPVFYTNQEIALTMTLDARVAFELRWSEQTDDFLKSLHSSHVALLRKPTIKIEADLKDFVLIDYEQHQDLFVVRIQLGSPKHSCSVGFKRLNLNALYLDFADIQQWEGDFQPIQDEVQATLELARNRTEDKTPQLKSEDLEAARRQMQAWLRKNISRK